MKKTSQAIQAHVDEINDTKIKVKRTQYYSHGGCELSLGNTKIGDDTLILNMGPAFGCPSDRLGKCACSAVCYAKKAEVQYPGARAYRRRQKFYWLQTSADKIAQDIAHVLVNKKFRDRETGKLSPLVNKIKYLRLNQSGDFWSQKCVNKLDHIARELKKYDVFTYTYTARDDLHFENCNFAVKGSGHGHGNNGRTDVALPGAIKSCTGEDGRYYHTDFINKTTRVYTICPGDCSKCTLCKEFNGLNIVFPLH